MSRKDARGTALGSFHMLTGLALLPASLIAGFLWNNMGADMAFMYGGAMSALASVLMLALVRNR